MEESSNGKLEEIQKVESQEEDKKVVVEESREVKVEAESLREIVVNGNSESANGDRDGDDSSSQSSSSDEEAETVENSPQVVDSGELEEEKTVINSVVDPIEPEVSLAEELTEDVEVAVEILDAHDDVAESESKEIEVNISQSLDESNGVSTDETNDMSKAIEEETLHSSDENNGASQVVTEIVSEMIGEIILPSSEENGEVPPADVVSNAIEETKLPVLEQNAKESPSTVDEPNQTMANVGNVDDTSNPGELANKPETIPGSTGNPPIISLTQRNFRPTSWRSCCGLLDVLRRSDR
ncbi:hypothetical protein Patl1_01469 [Pistacia atlantica]|uniref:Uncharacterized protein n=1 Tax=Pistacia atlantica TaxID=434234 RepID=A0ACC1C3X6_9ROSI|nr:hypothetical protein Patl1_01469 [Pistacia atlantica]